MTVVTLPLTAEILVAQAASTLARRGVPEARLDAELLLSHLLGFSRTDLYRRGAEPVLPQLVREYDRAVARRADREPVAYIVGAREFWGLPILVRPGIFIPRPESEHLIEAALSVNDPRTLLDLCSGSGALAVALARLFPEAAVDAVDISADAITAGRKNAGRHGCGRIRFYRGDLFAPLPEGSRYDLIICNPPYVAERDAPILPPEVLREPRQALFGGEDGLLFFRRIIPEVKSRLARSGRLLIEMGAGQAEEVSRLASRFDFAFRTLLDLAGIERVGILYRGASLPQARVLGDPSADRTRKVLTYPVDPIGGPRGDRSHTADPLGGAPTPTRMSPFGHTLSASARPPKPPAPRGRLGVPEDSVPAAWPPGTPSRVFGAESQRFASPAVAPANWGPRRFCPGGLAAGDPFPRLRGRKPEAPSPHARAGELGSPKILSRRASRRGPRLASSGQKAGGSLPFDG